MGLRLPMIILVVKAIIMTWMPPQIVKSTTTTTIADPFRPLPCKWEKLALHSPPLVLVQPLVVLVTPRRPATAIIITTIMPLRMLRRMRRRFDVPIQRMCLACPSPPLHQRRWRRHLREAYCPSHPCSHERRRTEKPMRRMKRESDRPNRFTVGKSPT